jgi:hypothetical protein
MDTVTDLLPATSAESRGPSPAKPSSRRGSSAPSLPRSRRSSRGPSLGPVNEMIGTPIITRDFAVVPPATAPHPRSRPFGRDFAAGPHSDPPAMASTEESYQVGPVVPEEAENAQVAEATEATETTEGGETTEVSEAAEVTEASGQVYHAVETTVEEAVAVVAATAVSVAVADAGAGADDSIISVGQAFGLPVYDESTFVDSTFVDDSVME